MAGSTFSKAVLAVANWPQVQHFLGETALARTLVGRFVAGTTLADALAASTALQARGLRIALDHLGENTADVMAAAAATDEAITALEQVHRSGLDAYLSVKLSQLGLDLGEHIVLENAVRLLDQARRFQNFVRLDMEGSAYTSRTIEIYQLLRQRYENVGIVIQAYLYRSMDDLRTLVPTGAQVRLCKGAYSEPPHIAFRRKRDTDRNYRRLMEFLLLHGNHPAIATHDEALLMHTCEFAREHRIAADRFEFQMLYGVRNDLQEALQRRGYGVRVYLPYGSQWYPYLTRRIAERPANLLFMLRSVLGTSRLPARQASFATLPEQQAPRVGPGT